MLLTSEHWLKCLSNPYIGGANLGSLIAEKFEFQFEWIRWKRNIAKGSREGLVADCRTWNLDKCIYIYIYRPVLRG